MESNDPRRAIFTNRPLATDVIVRLDVVRTPAKGPIRGIILARELTGASTHFWKGRSLPCQGQGCPACEDRTPKRWYGYLPLMSAKTQRVIIFEITGSATPAVDTYLATYKTLRGARLEAYRLPQRTNGRVVVELQPPLDPEEQLPRTPDIETALLNMWESSWARSSLSIRPGHANTTPDDILETIEKATEHKKHSRSFPRTNGLAPVDDLINPAYQTTDDPPPRRKHPPQD